MKIRVKANSTGCVLRKHRYKQKMINVIDYQGHTAHFGPQKCTTLILEKFI